MICKDCQVTLTADNAQPSTFDGRSRNRLCRVCRSVRTKAYNANRKETGLPYRSQIWRDENPVIYNEYMLAKNQDWRERNREKARAAVKNWRINNPEKYAEMIKAGEERKRARLLDPSLPPPKRGRPAVKAQIHNPPQPKPPQNQMADPHCKKCDVLLDDDNWTKSRQGKHYICSPCFRQYQREWKASKETPKTAKAKVYGKNGSAKKALAAYKERVEGLGKAPVPKTTKAGTALGYKERSEIMALIVALTKLLEE